MIDLYMWPTGNGKKITIMLEECALNYNPIPVNIGKGDQFSEEFSRLSPNNKMPVIVDHQTEDGVPLIIFESGAILQYLAEKSGKFLPSGVREKYKVLQWLYWQVGGLGPMAGQAHFYLRYSTEKIPASMERFRNEVKRLYTVLDNALEGLEFIAGEYSIADIAIWPWTARHEWQEQNLSDFPNVKRWYENIALRPAVIKALEVGKDWGNFSVQMSEEEKKRLFNL